MSQHKWPTEPTLKPMACLRGCGTTRQKYDARRWFYQAPGTMGGMSAPLCMPWAEKMARDAAPHVRDHTIVVRTNDGRTVIGKSYADRRVAFTQRTRLENETESNVYVATRDFNLVKVYTGPTTRLLAIDVTPPAWCPVIAKMVDAAWPGIARRHGIDPDEYGITLEHPPGVLTGWHYKGSGEPCVGWGWPALDAALLDLAAELERLASS